MDITEIDKLYNDDFLLVADIPPESFDAVITDPPYYILKDQEWDQQWETREDYLRWIRIVILRCYQLLKDNRTMFMFCSQYFQAEIDLLIRYETDFKILNRCVWYYPNNMAMYSKKGFKLCHEPFFFLLKGEIDTFNRSESFYDLNPSFFMDVKTYAMCKSTSVGFNKRVHPSQKPIELMEELVRVSTYEGEVVLEPFAGSGTTLVAAARNNRHYIGFERNPEYIPMIQERLAGSTGENSSPLYRGEVVKRQEQPGLFQ